MDYYHNLITAKSWQVLRDLRGKYQFILIGGWAVFLYSKALKSKDIDLVVEYDDLGKLRGKFEVIKNERLKKYEARIDEVEIDVYTPFFSNPGIPAEDIKKYTNKIEGFEAAEKEILAVLKQRAAKERAGTIKGRKDLIDLVSLFELADFNFTKFRNLVITYKAKDYSQILKQTIS